MSDAHRGADDDALDRPQNSMDVVAFDLDGTLADSGTFDGQLYVEAVRTVLGIEIEPDWSNFRHGTDSGILTETIERSNLNGDRSSMHSAVRRYFTNLVAEYVAARDGILPEIPGAREFIRRLVEHPGARVAVATGGWQETALIKLKAIGIDPARLSIASSSDAMGKADIMRIAEGRALPSGGARRKTYFGDEPYDRESSRRLGYEFIAIGNNVEHHVKYPDFRDADSILRDLGLAG